jgi:hypothetical protein
MTTPTIYDFTWDADGAQGVWCRDNDTEHCVEATTFEVPDGGLTGGDWWGQCEPTFDYLLASDITLEARDGLVVDGINGGEPVYGRRAARALAALQRIERDGAWLPSENHMLDGVPVKADGTHATN